MFYPSGRSWIERRKQQLNFPFLSSTYKDTTISAFHLGPSDTFTVLDGNSDFLLKPQTIKDQYVSYFPSLSLTDQLSQPDRQELFPLAYNFTKDTRILCPCHHIEHWRKSWKKKKIALHPGLSEWREGKCSIFSINPSVPTFSVTELDRRQWRTLFQSIHTRPKQKKMLDGCVLL